MIKKSLTTKDIARHCQVTQRTVVQWISEGKLQCFRTPGKHIRVENNDFLNFLKEYHMPIPAGLNVDLNKSGKKKILIVDDDKSMVDSIQRVLQLENIYDAQVAYDGFEAGQKFITHKPNLVILDIRMPRVDGYKLCSAIRNSPENKDVKILIISGLMSEQDQVKLKALGADDYLQKPFGNNELKSRIAHLVK